MNVTCVCFCLFQCSHEVINLQTIQISTCTNNHYTEIFWFCSPAEELRFVTDEDGKDAHDVISLKNTLPYPIAYKVNMFNKF